MSGPVKGPWTGQQAIYEWTPRGWTPAAGVHYGFYCEHPADDEATPCGRVEQVMYEAGAIIVCQAHKPGDGEAELLRAEAAEDELPRPTRRSEG